MPFVAECPDCNKRYHVPHTEKAWRCKVCEAVLVVNGGPEEALVPEETCPDCGAPQGGDKHFCGECGADLGGGEHLSKDRRRLERKERGKIMRRAAKPIQLIRNVLMAWAGLMACYFSLSLLWVYSAWGSDSLGPVVAVASVLGIELAILVVVIKQLKRRPFPAMLTLAIFRTTTFALFEASTLVQSLSAGSVPIIPVISIMILVFYWSVTARVAAQAKLFKENPEMYAARRMRGETKHLQQRDGAARTRHKARSKMQIPWVAVGSGVAVVVLGIGGCMWSEHNNKPEPPPEPTLPTAAIAAFQEAWNASDVEELTKDIQAHRQAKWKAFFHKYADRYSWGTDWPTIKDSVITEQTQTRATIEFATNLGPLVVKLRWNAYEDWDVYGVSYSQLNIPDQD